MINIIHDQMILLHANKTLLHANKTQYDPSTKM
jgi:hypothetical protein